MTITQVVSVQDVKKKNPLLGHLLRIEFWFDIMKPVSSIIFSSVAISTNTASAAETAEPMIFLLA
jgi:hypothetical protein